MDHSVDVTDIQNISFNFFYTFLFFRLNCLAVT